MASTLVTRGETDVSTEKRDIGTKLGDLPEACIAAILAFTAPSDAARLACVNRTFRDASRSDVVWQKMLPARFREIISRVSSWHPTNSSKMEVYNFLCYGCFRQSDTREIWLDKASGGVCLSVGARGLHIFEEDRLSWSWLSREGSRYPEVALSQLTFRLDVKGRLQCHLPPGQYALSWRVCMAYSFTSAEWCFKPVKFTFEANSRLVSTERYLMANHGATNWPLSGFYKTWMDVDVGEFTVEEGDSAVELSFSMAQTEGEHKKSGLCLDCVLIRPASVRRAVVQRNFPRPTGRPTKLQWLDQQEELKWLEQQEGSEWREMQKMMFR